MAKANVKILGFIGFADAYGDGWLSVMQAAAKAKGIEIAAIEKYGQTDTSVTGQVLKLIAAKPDAILVAGAGTPAALPQKKLRARNYAGTIYQTHGAANSEVLRVCGKDCEGMLLPASPCWWPSNCLTAMRPSNRLWSTSKSMRPNTVRARPVHSAAMYGMLSNWLWRPCRVALKTGAKPSTPEFRAAMRDALEGVKTWRRRKVCSLWMPPIMPADDRSRVMVKVQDGKWVYQPDL